MKFACKCGKIIPDQTDYLPYAAYLIADQDIYEATDSANRSSGDWWPSLARKMFQCSSCGRIWIQDHNKTLKAFTPEEPVNHFLSSVHGKQWKRILRGSWTDKPIAATFPRGFLSWTHPSDDDRATFDDWALLKQAYDKQFEDLKRQGILRNAGLTKNGETIHFWSYDSDIQNKGESGTEAN